MGRCHPQPLVVGSDRGRWRSWPAQGLYRASAKNALVRATAVEALQQAKGRMRSAQVELGAADERLCAARSSKACDGHLSRLSISSAGEPIGEWLVLAAHPTSIRKRNRDPDYPGALAERRLQADAGVALVLQGSGGNASVPAGATPVEFAAQVESKAPAALALAPSDSAGGLSRVSLPHPDAARLVPSSAACRRVHPVPVGGARSRGLRDSARLDVARRASGGDLTTREAADVLRARFAARVFGERVPRVSRACGGGRPGRRRIAAAVLRRGNVRGAGRGGEACGRGGALTRL